jgi:hypothetical protein
MAKPTRACLRDKGRGPRIFQDFKDLLSAFNAHSVKYLITGSTKAGGDHVGPSASDTSKRIRQSAAFVANPLRELYSRSVEFLAVQTENVRRTRFRSL